MYNFIKKSQKYRKNIYVHVYELKRVLCLRSTGAVFGGFGNDSSRDLLNIPQQETMFRPHTNLMTVGPVNSLESSRQELTILVSSLRKFNNLIRNQIVLDFPETREQSRLENRYEGN